ncbi:virulence factor [uncultured Sneathiella sp.]|uniref:virulence factor n=1 Tax=uncultured Sneathiella sp. TaxID=879315 RepID=UPI0030DC9EB4
MAQLSILYWRDIPSQVVVKQGRSNAKIMLSDRFQEAIDVAAMRDKAHESDAYLEGWRRGEAESVDGDIQAVAEARAGEIESDYDAEKLRALVVSGGREGL